MKSLRDYFDQEDKNFDRPVTGDTLAINLREECLLESEIIEHNDDSITLLVDQRALELLEQYGALSEKMIDIDGTDVDEYDFDTEEEVAESDLMELGDDPGYKGSQGTALGGAKPTAGKPMQGAADLKAAQQKAAAAGSPAPSPGYSKQYPVTNAMTAQMAQGTSGRYGTSTNPSAAVKKPAAKPSAAPNPNQAAVDAANAVQKGQMDNLAGNTPAAAPDIEAQKTGLAAGSSAAQAAQTTEPTPSPQANALGIQSAANVPGSPTAALPVSQTSAAAPSTAPSARSLPITTTGGPTAANPTSTNTTPTQGGPAVAGTSNVRSSSDAEIAARGPMGTTRPTPAAAPTDAQGNRVQTKGFLDTAKDILSGTNKSPAAPTATGDQTAGGKTNADFLPGAAGGAGAKMQAVPEPKIDTIQSSAPATMAEDLGRILELAGRPVMESRNHRRAMITEGDESRDVMGHMGDIGARGPHGGSPVQDPGAFPGLPGAGSKASVWRGPGGETMTKPRALQKPRIDLPTTQDPAAKLAAAAQAQRQVTKEPVIVLPPGSFAAKLADKLFSEPRARIEPKIVEPNEPVMRAREPQTGMERHQDYYQKAMPKDTLGGKIVDRLMGRKNEAVNESADDFDRILNLAGVSRRLDEDDIGHDTVTGIMRERDHSDDGYCDSCDRVASKCICDKTVSECGDEPGMQDAGEYDYEGDMAKDDLYTIVRAARRLNGLLDDDENMPEWVQSKINKAADYVDTAADYIESNKQQELEMDEAEYQGRDVALGKPMQGDVKKFKVYVKDPSTGNVKKVNFGDKTMRIKKSNPARRRSFRARHNCANPGPRTKARYWSCRKW